MNIWTKGIHYTSTVTPRGIGFTSRDETLLTPYENLEIDTSLSRATHSHGTAGEKKRKDIPTGYPRLIKCTMAIVT